MKISVKVKTKAKEEKVEEISNNNFIVSVNAAPEDGKANEAVCKALAEYFDTPVSNVEILRGFSSKIKTIEIFQ